MSAAAARVQEQRARQEALSAAIRAMRGGNGDGNAQVRERERERERERVCIRGK